MRWSRCLVAGLLLIGCSSDGESSGGAGGTGSQSGGNSGAGGSGGAGSGGSENGGSAGTSSGGAQHGGSQSGGNAGTSGASAGGSGATSNGGSSGAGGGAGSGGGTTLPVLPSAGCGKTGSPTGKLPDQTSSVNGVPRGYDLFVPSAYDENRAALLVFTYHGAGGNANTNQFKFDDFSNAHGGASIQVAPQGWTSPEWDTNHFVPFNLEDSLQLFDQVLDELAQNYCIDLNRVFAMGHSNGAQMAFHLGCLRGDKLRAIMPNAGRCFSYGAGVCDPDHPPSSQQCQGEVMVLSVMGEDDTTRHADEAATVAGFRQRARCSSETEARDPSPCQRFLGCDANAEVATCRIPNLAHAIWQDGREGLYDYMLSL